MNRPWFPFYVGDYTRDTARLTTEAHGAYLLLILDYWVNGPPPDDNEVLATITKLPVTIWRKRRAAILPFFKVIDGRWTHSRIDREIALADEKHQKRVEAGKEGGKAKAKGKQTSSNATPELPALPYQSQSQPPSPSNPDSKKGESNSPSVLKLVEEGRPRPIDETYQPSEPAIEYAFSLGMKKAELDDELRKFVTKSISLRVVSFNIDMNFKLWCDRWLEFKRKNNPDWKPAPVVDDKPLPPKFRVIQGTPEGVAWDHNQRSKRLPPLFYSKHLVDGVEVIAALCDTLWPEGYDEATGERIAPTNEEDAA
jgi:uncharacterized protein YdaU (DUF1376 family)